MTDTSFRNAPVREEYGDIISALRPVLYDLPPIIVAIDGRAGVGKTTLGRFLAWRFNTTLVETDLFLVSEKIGFHYRFSDIEAIIQHRLNSDRPVIIEGVVALRILGQLQLEPKYHIRLNCDDSEGSSLTESEWLRYLDELGPQAVPDLELDLPAET